MKIAYFEGKGGGIVTTKKFMKGNYVLIYVGNLKTQDTGETRYTIFFTYNGKKQCIDATEESPHLGRLINHARDFNIVPPKVVVDKIPRY